MARNALRERGLIRSLLEHVRVHGRVIVSLGAVTAVGVVIVGILTLLYAALLSRVALAQLAAWSASAESTSLTTLVIVAPIALLFAVASVVWAGVAVQVANAAATNRSISTTRASISSLRQVPRAIALIAFVLVVVALALAATPVLVVVGLVGLLVNRVQPRWSTSTLIVLAVPFAAAIALALRWSLALPSLWLAGASIRGALGDSAERARGRGVQLAVVFVLSALVTFALTEGLVAAVGTLGLGVYPEFLTRVVALILVGPLVPVAFALQYRAGGDAPPAPPTVNPRVASRARTAVAVIVSLVIPIVVSGNPVSAQAVGTSEVSFVIGTLDAEPLPVATPTTIYFSVTDAHSAEGAQPTGEIAIAIDGVPLTGPFPLAGNGSQFQLAQSFTAGSHLIEAAYPGDANFEYKTASLTVQVGSPPPAVETTTAFTLSPSSPSPAGGTVTAHVTVTANSGTDTPTGTVGMYLNDQSEPPLAEAVLVAGTADLSFTLSPGANHVVVYYTAGSGFFDSHIDDTQYVSRYTPSVSIAADPSSAYGDPVEITATVTAGVVPTGTVSFEAVPSGGGSIDLGSGALDGSGIATVTTSVLDVGDYDLVAHYGGDTAVLSGDSTSAPHSVTVASVVVDVVSDTAAPSYGDTATLTVTVTPAAGGSDVPSGTIELTRDGTPIGSPATLVSGWTTIGVDVGAGGDHTIIATYTPAVTETRFTGGSGQLDYSVAPLSTTTRVFGPYTRSADYGDDQTYAGSVFTSGGAVPTGTVELLVAGELVDGAEATLAGDGTFVISTDLIPVMAEYRAVTVRYLGDGNFEPSVSPVDPSEAITLQLQKATSVPVLTVSASDLTVGDTVTLTATLDDLGAGPTGTVSFVNLSTDPDAVLGTSSVIGGTATLELVVPSTAMQIVAIYSGDGNFEAETSTMISLTADKVAATVSLADPGTVEYGTLFYLDATVALGDLAPELGVEFRTSSNVVLDASVPVVAGHARLQVCAGDDADCPDGVAYLGAGALTLKASYPESAVNWGAESASVDYDMTPALTTTVVTINPTTVDPGAGIYLTATVTGTTSPATPTGHVTFYAEMPGASFIATEDLVDGVATVFVTAGTGLTDIRWPASAIRAEYFPVPSTKFASSAGSTPITVDRFDVTLSGYAPAATTLAPVAVSVDFTHEPGTSAPYTGTLTITQDVGPGCVISLPVTPPVGCDLTWSTSGAHSFSASYSGDLVFEAATLAPVAVNIGVATPNFVPSVDSTAVALTDTTVTWNLFNAGATGTVTVWGDGTLWCTTPLATQSCTGQFGTSSATGSPVDVVVRYSGDANWGAAEVHKSVLVKRCVIPDVTSSSPSMGTVHIDTISNCGVDGYLSGTAITVTATAISPSVFVNWKKLGGTGLVVDSTLSTITFVVTTDSTTWVRVATFSADCYPVTADVTGHGAISVYPATNCTKPSGVAGYLPGTAIWVYPDTLYNPTYDEHDAFYSFGTVVGGTLGKDSSNRPRVSATVNAPLVIPVTFGPQCRSVLVTFAPPTAGDVATVATPENCQSPQANGFLRFSTVDVHAASGDPTLAIAGWTLNGVAQPDRGTANDQTVTIGVEPLVLTLSLVHCYALDVTVDGAVDARNHPVGQVNTDPGPNCPDGSERFLGDTEVTLTPELLVADSIFTGWGTDRLNYRLPEGEVGEVTKATRTVTMTADVAITAGFYLDETCSSLYVFARPTNLIQFDDAGCGVGSYFDLQKQTAIRVGEPQETYWQTRNRTLLTATINPDVPLDVYVSVLGDTGNCFGTPGVRGPNENTNAWVSYGPLTKPTDDCEVGGPMGFRAEACQSLVTDLRLTVAGDPSGATYGSGAIPANLYLPGPDGAIATFSMEGFDWIDSLPVYFDGDAIKATSIANGACRDAGNAFPADTTIVVYAFGPTSGISFSGWADVEPAGLVKDNPVVALTTATEPELKVAPSYTVTCHTLSFGEGISIIGDAPYCPGSDPADNSFIAGTAVQVKAAQHIGERPLYGFTSGIVASQVYEDPTTKELTSFAYVDGDKRVTADYPTKGESWTRSLIQGLKISVGVFAVAAPIFVGLLFPPAGILFAYLGAAAGIASMVPNGGQDVASVFDLINPTKITTCAARWAFSNPGNPTGGGNYGSIVSTANTIRKIYKDVDVSIQPVGLLGASAAIAGFGYGLYDAGIAGAEFDTQTVEELRGTSTMTGCLNDQWQTAGANL